MKIATTIAMTIAIDGPAASGKGTVSKVLAGKLNGAHLNTGLIYRLLALQSDEKNAVKNSQNFGQIWHKYTQNPENFTEIFSNENGLNASKIAQIKEVRANLVQFQRDFAAQHPISIVEGRDIGSVILPDADFKFYIDASPQERAKRRFLQLPAQENTTYESILDDIIRRDNADKTRTESPLLLVPDAVYIDTTGLAIEATVSRILDVINKGKNPN